MTATEEVCRLLDERGVEWWPNEGDPAHLTERVTDGVRYKYRQIGHGLIVSACTEGAITPEQAIAVTLGPGECHITDNGPWGYPYVCSACGASFDQDVNNGEFNYCPNCGRKVVDE